MLIELYVPANKPSDDHGRPIKQKHPSSQDNTSDDNIVIIDSIVPSTDAVAVGGKKKEGAKGSRKNGRKSEEVNSVGGEVGSKTVGNLNKGKKHEHGEDKGESETTMQAKDKRVKKLTEREEIIANFLKLMEVEGKDKVERDLESLIKLDQKKDKTNWFVSLCLIFVHFTHLSSLSQGNPMLLPAPASPSQP